MNKRKRSSELGGAISGRLVQDALPSKVTSEQRLECTGGQSLCASRKENSTCKGPVVGLHARLHLLARRLQNTSDSRAPQISTEALLADLLMSVRTGVFPGEASGRGHTHRATDG